jgi:glucose/arabinose dehydrogenase
MKRIALNRGLRIGLPLPLLLIAAFLGACTRAPIVYKSKDQTSLDRRNVEYPAGFELKLAMANLNAPTSFCFDTDGTMLVAEGGIEGDEPRIFGVKPDGTLITVYPTSRRIPFSPLQPGFQIYGPIGGMVADHRRIFVSHRDKDGRGVITQFGYDGSHKTIKGDLPAQGDYGVTDLVIGPRDRLYFGIGSATNSGIVGLDNIRWLRRHEQLCDQSYVDLELVGLRFYTKNPFAGLFGGNDTINTGPFQPFGVSDRARIDHAPNGLPNSAVCSVALTGGDFRVEAFGIRYPHGLAFYPGVTTALYVTNDGMEMRGSRPVKDDPDVVLRVYPDHPAQWYGFPDYSTDMVPITDKRFQPPVALILRSGFPKLSFLFDHKASDLHEIDENAQSFVGARLPPLSGAAKLVFAPGSGPLKRWYGDAFVALSGDRAPYATSGEPLKAPVGYKVVRVNVDSHRVEEFIHNTEFLPGSRTGHSGVALERPIDVKIGPDGALYILDFGRVEYKSDGRQKTDRGTGRVFRLTPEAHPTTTQP